MGIGFLVGLALAFLVGGLQGRMLALCGLSRTGQEKRSRFVRANGPFTLAMIAFGTAGHPCGKLPHLLLAQVFTEAVYTGWRGPVRGKRRRDFMVRVGIYNDGGLPRRLRDRMARLFGCAISLHYLSDHKSVRLDSVIVDEAVFRWDLHRPDMDNLFPSEIRLSQPYFDSIARQPIPIDLNCLHAQRRSTLRLELYDWLSDRTFSHTPPLTLTRKQFYVQHGPFPEKAGGSFTVQIFRDMCLRELKNIQLTWHELHYTTEPGRLILHPTPAQIPPGRKPDACASALRHMSPLPCFASLKVTAGPPVFQSRSPAPSSSRAFGCLLALACRLSRLAGASQPPELWPLAQRGVCHCLAHAATARPRTRLRFVLPATGFGRCRRSRVSGKRSQTLNA